jgi:beta-xylosidase
VSLAGPVTYCFVLTYLFRYSIRVGRSQSPRGPFTDKSGKDLVKGGGELVYGSNGETYAPGGQAVLRDGDTDVLYYHYCAFTPRPLFFNFILTSSQ